MKKNAFLILTVVAAIYMLAACNKFKDIWYPVFQNPQKEFDLCRITQIHQSAGPLVPDRTGNFYYSSRGNLDSVVFDDGGIVHFFKYDSHNVLVEYRDAFDHDITDFKTLHRYASENGRVIRDTTWSEGASGYIIAVWSLQYDSKGRVVRETGVRIDDEAPGEVLNDKVYVYDERGNLVGGGPYDDEVNYLRTNKVLQFVHRNYSMNNEAPFVLGYTPYHLPSGFRMLDYGSFLGGSLPTKLTYSCEPIPPVVSQRKDCQITYVKQMSGTDAVDGNIFYTPEGRPLSVQYKSPKYPVEASIHRFIYGKRGELTGYEIIEGVVAQARHSYGYTGNRITVDTFYYSRSYEFIQISTLQYDNQGRITREDVKVIERDFIPVNESSTKQFVYDDRGNLVSPLVTAYDNKVSYLRTDPLWMFIHRNYSKNNPQGVTGYNDKNLPLGFNKNSFSFLDFGQPVEIRYLCPDRVR